MLSGCQEAVNKLSREKIFFAQTHFLESTNQNTNVNTKIPKNKNRRNFSSGCQEAVKKLSTRCRRAVGPALRGNPSSTEVKSCQSAPQGVSIDPCQADTKKFRPALLAVQGVFTLWSRTPLWAEHHPNLAEHHFEQNTTLSRTPPKIRIFKKQSARYTQ